MKKLTVLLATLFVFLSGNAQQILAGIYSGSMYNDSTRMLQKYELALSEYRGKVFGYSYVTFVVNDTFYYGIRRVKGYKNDRSELILTDDELLANNFPESPAKRVRRTATFKLAQEDTITNLVGTWQTNRTRQYYSVGGATKTERTVDSSQSPLVAHLQELKIIAGGPNYQEEAVVKTKPKKEDKKPKDTEVAKRNDHKESEPLAGKAPAEKNGNPAEHKETTVDKDAVAATDHKPADKTLAGNKTAQTETKSSPLPPADRTAVSRKDSDAVARANKPDAGPTGTTDKGAVAANNQTHQPDASNTQLPGNKNAAATADPARVAGNAAGSYPDKPVAATTGAQNNSTGVKPEGGNKAVAGIPTSAQKNAEPGNNQAVALTGDASKTITGPSRNTTNPVASADNATEAKPSAAGVKPPAAPAAGKPTAQNAVQTTAGKPTPAAGRPAADGTKDVAAAADRKPLENKATGDIKEVAVKTPASDSRSGNKDNGNKTSPASVAQKPGQNSTAVVAAGADIKKQTEGDKTTPDKVAAPKNDNIAAAGNPASTAAGSDTKGATGPTAAAKDAAPANTAGNEKTAVAATTPDSRTSAVIKTLEVVNDSITLSFYDNGVVDGDVISVYVNGQNIVANARLNEVALKKTIHLANFAGDTVEVTLVAETLGSIPPNTGLLLVYDGDKRYDVRFSADMKTNASIVFRKGKK